MSFFERTEQSVLSIVARCLERSHDERHRLVAPLLIAKTLLVERLPPNADINHPELERFVAAIPHDLLLTFAEMDAKLIDIQSRARLACVLLLLDQLTTEGGVK